MNTGPEHAQTGKYLFFVMEQAKTLTAFVLQVVVGLGRDAQMPRHVQMIVGRLKILDPSFARNADLRVAEQMHIGGGVELKGSDDYRGNIVGRKALIAENVLHQL